MRFKNRKTYPDDVTLVRRVERDDPGSHPEQDTFVVRRPDGMEVYAMRDDLDPDDLAAAEEETREAEANRSVEDGEDRPEEDGEDQSDDAKASRAASRRSADAKKADDEKKDEDKTSRASFVGSPIPSGSLGAAGVASSAKPATVTSTSTSIPPDGGDKR